MSLPHPHGDRSFDGARRGLKPSMTQNLYLVFSKPPSWVRTSEYNRWYDSHLYEILRAPGFVAARRYAMTGSRGTGVPAGIPYLSLYETVGETEGLRQDLVSEAPHMQLPDWFRGIEFTSWVAEDVGDDGGFATPDHLYLVFSHRPDHLGPDAYAEWYREHQRANVARTEHLLHGWRYHLIPRGAASRDPEAAAASPTLLGLYEMSGTVADMYIDLDRGMGDGTITLPGWFRLSASMEAKAIGGRVNKGDTPVAH